MNILIVDDDKTSLKLITNNLSKHIENIDIVTFSDSTVVPDHLKYSGNRYGLIILDIVMPDINGLELAKIIRTIKGFESTPIMFVTSLEDDQTKIFQEFSLVKNVDFIRKPIIDNVFFLARVQIYTNLFLETMEKEVAIKQLKTATSLLFKLAKASNWLLKHNVSDVSFKLLLSEFGELLEASRAYIYKQSNNKYELQYHWSSTGSRPPEAVLTVSESEYYNNILDKGGVVTTSKNSTDTWVFTETCNYCIEGKRTNFSEGIKSMTSIPIYTSDGLYGFFGFDSKSEVEWSSLEISAINAIASIFGTLVNKSQTVAQFKNSLKIYTERIENTISRSKYLTNKQQQVAEM